MIDTDNNQVTTYLQLVGCFAIEGSPVSITPFGSGHINDTYKILTDSPDGPNYMLQRINNNVFKNVDHLMENIDKVCNHIKNKLKSEGVSALEDHVLTPIPTKNGALYHKDEQDNYWRIFVLIEGTKTYDIVETTQQAKEGGRAFGKFQAMLADLNPLDIHEVIPSFLHIGSRLRHFKQAIEQDAAGRVNELKEETTFILERENKMNTVLGMAAKSQIPLRITHNDTKFNNVLLNRDDRAQCVIDLDTVMPGYVAYDFGDAIRTIINTAAEDEADTRKVLLNIPLFEAYTKGYLESAHHFLYPMEVTSLVDGVLLLPYMQMVRFLTDYLSGDTYYKINHPKHNLQRTKAQMKLVQEIEKHESLLRNIVRKEADTYQT
ncbi:aminoglycoside phosphotransferase family protein [Olivibacter sp. SDN3]|uniref:phosphotransferase enzyme family protein n=1 Tax=Olivibacter sp. SDN3 TaxID=2764720 RepID=UPI001650FD5F|nr:aminoglycoside phosphotransferase family protein [Olivibacter sp. SDN3]QNL48525.1 aminoglycoside phosphotransferase family protein [Olivibacter sp. SDN3]